MASKESEFILLPLIYETPNVQDEYFQLWGPFISAKPQ